jgi:hypothetical protein
MITEGMVRGHLKREVARRQAAAHKPQDAGTPQQNLVRAAETGGFEAIVAAAQPAEPPKMVTPEEREAELHAKGQWPDKGHDKPKARRKAEKKAKPKEPKPPLTPQQQFIDENCRWTQRGPDDYRERVPYGRCMTEYDPLTGEIIGDGYAHDEEDDEC